MAGLRRGRAEPSRRSVIFEALESRRLLSVSPLLATASDDSEKTVGGCPLCGAVGCVEHRGDDGTVMMACHFEPDGDLRDTLTLQATAAMEEPAVTSSLAPLDQTFRLHSNPTASKVVYLDFDGHVTSGTNWRNGSTFSNEAYSLDDDFTTFSDADRQAIQKIWTRVAEDFVAFDVNVTTEEPPLEDLRKAGANDVRWGIRVVVGGDWADAAGIAYVNSFNWNSDTPAFVFAGKWWKTNLNFVATAISHEAGHTLGLGHDGYDGNTYYAGRGSGETSWGPIMGNPSNKSLTQWSKGEYGGATNLQDDLAIITTKNGFGYRADDHGNALSSATVIDFTAGKGSATGIIERNTDVDMFRFTTTGSIEAAIDPIAFGTNLDILATLYDANGNVVATSNPVDAVAASFSLKVAAGTYSIAVRGTGMGDIDKTGYTAYGSLGQYTVTVDTGTLPTLSVADVSMTEGHSGTASMTVRVTLSAVATAAVTVDYATADDTATAADADYLPVAGTLTWAAGDPRVKTFVVGVIRDRRVEADEQFLVRLSNPQGATIARGLASVTIRDDDSPPALGAIGPLDAVSTTYGTASGVTLLTVSGSNLPGDITATAPAGFEVSSDGEAFGPTATFVPTLNDVDGTLHIRLAAGTNAGIHAGDVVLSCPGLVDVTEAMPPSEVMPRELTLTGLVAESRPYDGTTVATLSGTALLVGRLAGDSVALSGTAVGTFDSKDVNTATAVTVGGLGLRGTKAANYSLTLPTLPASILPRPLTVTAADGSRPYGGANPPLSATFTGFVAGETASTALTGQALLKTTATPSSDVGSYPITVEPGTLAALHGNYAFSFVPGTLTVVAAAPPPIVSGVYVRGSGWNAGYLARTPFTTLDDAALGWRLPDGGAQLTGTATVSWSNVDVISVRFDQPIAQPAADALELVLGTAGGNQAIVPTATPTLLAGGTVAQWTLPAALATGRYVISIAAAGISNAAGTATLDGEWTTSASTFAAGSGDGTAGGTFSFFFNVLVGNVNGDTVTNAGDISAIRTKLTSPLNTPLASDADFRLDMDGTNTLTAGDISQIRRELTGALGTPLSSLPPVTAPAEDTPLSAQSFAALAAGGTVSPGLSTDAWAWYAIDTGLEDQGDDR